jgi:hypothetical protein
MAANPDKLVRVERTRGRISLARLVPDLKYGDMFRVAVHGDQIILTRVKAVPLVNAEVGRDDT